MTERAVPRPEGVELLANLLLGPDGAAAPALPDATGDGPRAAFDRVLVPALSRPPCVVSFSGGRDSSAMLATALDVARRHGLPEPVAAIMRFRGAPQSDETSWQELVLGHVRARSVEVLELGDELDLLGPAARGVLQRCGLLWPANAYMHLPVLELARGGSLVTGIGGDELLGTTAARHVLLSRGRARPRPRDLRTLLGAALPRAARAARRRRHVPELGWLTRAGADTVRRAVARDEVAWPARWDAALRHWRATRGFAALAGAIGVVARDHDVAVVHPFVADEVLAELAVAGGATGFASRAAAMRELFGAVLPDAVLARGTKASFTGAVFGPAVRRFADDWDGTGIDERLVDAAALRAEWLAGEPDFRTSLLLHAAWTHAQGSAASS